MLNCSWGDIVCSIKKARFIFWSLYFIFSLHMPSLHLPMNDTNKGGFRNCFYSKQTENRCALYMYLYPGPHFCRFPSYLQASLWSYIRAFDYCQQFKYCSSKHLEKLRHQFYAFNKKRLKENQRYSYWAVLWCQQL